MAELIYTRTMLTQEVCQNGKWLEITLQDRLDGRRYRFLANVDDKRWTVGRVEVVPVIREEQEQDTTYHDTDQTSLPLHEEES